MPYITNATITITDVSQKAEAVEAIEVIADLNLGSLVLVQIVVPVTCPGSVKHIAKNVFTATKRDISVNYVIPGQRGKISRVQGLRNQTNNNNRYSHHYVHEIDQSHFDDSVQFEQDSITIQFQDPG